MSTEDRKIFAVNSTTPPEELVELMQAALDNIRDRVIQGEEHHPECILELASMAAVTLRLQQNILLGVTVIMVDGA